MRSCVRTDGHTRVGKLAQGMPVQVRRATSRQRQVPPGAPTDVIADHEERRRNLARVQRREGVLAEARVRIVKADHELARALALVRRRLENTLLERVTVNAFEARRLQGVEVRRKLAPRAPGAPHLGRSDLVVGENGRNANRRMTERAAPVTVRRRSDQRRRQRTRTGPQRRLHQPLPVWPKPPDERSVSDKPRTSMFG